MSKAAENKVWSENRPQEVAIRRSLVPTIDVLPNELD